MKLANISAELLRELYVEKKMGIEKIAKLLGHSNATIWKRLRKYGMPIRPQRPIPDLRPSPALAYVCGVLKGDGFLYYDEKRENCRLGLNTKERAFAESFRSALERLGLRARLCFTPSSGMWRVDASSAELCRWFAGGGWRSVAEQYPADFIRGFYESEGSLNLRRCNCGRCRGTLVVQIEMINTDLQLLEFVRLLVERLGFRTSIRRRAADKVTPSGLLYRNHVTYSLAVLGSRREKYEFLKLISPCVKNDLLRVDEELLGPRPYKPMKYPEELVRRAFELRAEGWGYRSVAKILGLSPYTVKYWFKSKRLQQLFSTSSGVPASPSREVFS